MVHSVPEMFDTSRLQANFTPGLTSGSAGSCSQTGQTAGEIIKTCCLGPLQINATSLLKFLGVLSSYF